MPPESQNEHQAAAPEPVRLSDSHVAQTSSSALFWGLLVLIAGLSLSAIFTRIVWNDANQLDAVRFSQLATAAKEAFDTKTEYYERSLNELRTWLQMAESPSLAEWENQVEQMRLEVNLRAIVELGYMPYLVSENAARWAQRVPKHLTNLWPNLIKGPHQIVAYSATTPEWRLSRFGQSLELKPDGNAYMYAVGSGDLRVSKRFDVTPTQPGFRAYLATYPPSMPSVDRPDRLSESELKKERSRLRLHSFTGMLFCDIAAKPLMEWIYGKEASDLEVDLYAGPPKEEHRLFDLSRPALSTSLSFRQNLGTHIEFAFFGEKWTLSCAATPLFWKKSHRPQALRVLMLGSILSLALAGLVFVQVRARTQAEAFARDLEQSRELLRQATEHRAQLSRNLHDGTMQSLYVIGMRLQHSRAIPQIPTALDASLREVVGDLDTVIKDLRTHLESQREGLPPTSLGKALLELVTRWQQSTSTRIDVRLDETNLRPVPAGVALEVIAMVQEAVSNSLRHANASRITLEAELDTTELRLSVEDNGVGFEASTAPTGQGLANQRARAAELGGTCVVSSRPGGPTKVEICVRLS